MDENDIAPGELLSPAHLLLHHLAVMDDELEIEIAHRDAGLALAGRGLANVAQPSAEFEIGALDRVLQQRAVDLLGHRVDECGVALEFGEAKRGAQPFTTVSMKSAMMILRVVEFVRREEVGIAGDVSNLVICRFSLGSMSPPPQSVTSDFSDAQSVLRRRVRSRAREPAPSSRQRRALPCRLRPPL